MLPSVNYPFGALRSNSGIPSAPSDTCFIPLLTSYAPQLHGMPQLFFVRHPLICQHLSNKKQTSPFYREHSSRTKQKEWTRRELNPRPFTGIILRSWNEMRSENHTPRPRALESVCVFATNLEVGIYLIKICKSEIHATWSPSVHGRLRNLFGQPPRRAGTNYRRSRMTSGELCLIGIPLSLCRRYQS